MKHPVKGELWECPECGARVATGRYERLARWGRDNCRADLVEIERDKAEALLTSPSPQPNVVPQFLPTEDGEFNGNVGELIVPPHCSGYSFVFEPGVLHVKKDGSGYIAVNEEDFVLEDDRDCEGGSIHWIARMAASEITALRDFLNGTPQQQENSMTEDQIKHMVNRFLGWKLPENFNPDGGVSFQKTFNEHTDHPMKHEPSGTNLLDASQAETMIRYLLEGLPPSQHVAATEAAKRYLEAIDSDPENDIWDTWDGKPAEGALKTASDASWADHGQKIEARLSELRAALATTEGKDNA